MRARKRFDALGTDLPFGMDRRLTDPRIKHQTVAVLHQQMAHVAELGGGAFALAKEKDLRVSLRGMGVARAPLAPKVHRGVASAALRRRFVFVLGPIALERGQCLDQRAVDAEVNGGRV